VRYRLRTLMIATAIGPPALAVIWFWGPVLLILALILVVGLLQLAVVSALSFVIVLPVAWLFAMAAKVLLHYGRHPDNRQ
jgi:hypothetical protein